MHKKEEGKGRGKEGGGKEGRQEIVEYEVKDGERRIEMQEKSESLYIVMEHEMVKALVENVYEVA